MAMQRTQIAGFDIDWDLETGIQRWAGAPTLMLWIQGSLSGLMAGVHKMVGTERFNLLLQEGGREGVDVDWQVIAAQPTFEEGFEQLAIGAASSGWGRWRLLKCDRKAKEATFRVENSWEATYQKALGASWGSSYIAGKLAGYCTKLFGVNCWAVQTACSTAGDQYDEFVVRPSDITVETKMQEMFATDQATRADLAAAMHRLQREIEERKTAEQKLLEQLEFIKQQEAAIQELATPILKVWDNILAIPLIGVVNHQRAALMMERILPEISRSRSQYLILDLTGVELIDTSTAEYVVKLVRAAELLGGRSVITGIRPAVAQTIVSLGIDLTRVLTAGDLQKGLRQCMEWSSAAAGNEKAGARPK